MEKNEKIGLVSKAIKHSDTLIILAAIASMFFYFDAKFTADNDRFFEQQKQFSDTLEKIGQIDKQSLQRDHRLELRVAKLED